MNDKSRKEFEEWIITIEPNADLSKTESGEHYYKFFIGCYWKAWQHQQKKIEQLEREKAEAVNLINAVIKWNTDYPSSRIYSHSQIVGIADEMDVIFEQCKTAVAYWQELKEERG